MDIRIKELTETELAEAVKIWNSVVEDGVAFPQMETLTLESGREFFAGQSYVGVACHMTEQSNMEDSDRSIDMENADQHDMEEQMVHSVDERYEVVGLYILHPNNVGRCGHICNASYAVRKDCRGQHIGEALVKDCMEKAKELGYRILQFNAVVKSNESALALYQKLGFTQLGSIPNGFLLKDGSYEDIILHYIELTT